MLGPRARGWTLVLGGSLAFLLVVALPFCLLWAGAPGDAGAGTGDLSAAALSSLDRSLQTPHGMPPHDVVPGPFHGEVGALEACSLRGTRAVPLRVPSSCTPSAVAAESRRLL